jgi:hypothetical protein
MALFIASFSAFLTWLTLESAGLPPDAIRWWSAGVFLTVAVLLVSYMISCIRRHCGHQRGFSH